VPVIACSISENTLDRFVFEGMNSIEGPHPVQFFLPDEEYQNGPPADLDAFRQSASNLEISPITVNGGWRPTHVRAIREADVVLAIGGDERGTGNVIASAEVLEKPVLVVRSFQGAANNAWQDLSHYYTDPEKQTLGASPSDSWPAEIVKLCRDFAKRNPMRRSKLLPGIIAAFVTVLLLVAWLVLIGSESVVQITVLAIIAATLGVVLRHAANHKSIDSTAIWWDLIQALIIGFVLVSLATTLVGVDFFSQIAGEKRAETAVKFGGIALLAGLVTPNFVEWLIARAKSNFPGKS
jgi:hypothetical protein